MIGHFPAPAVGRRLIDAGPPGCGGQITVFSQVENVGSFGTLLSRSLKVGCVEMLRPPRSLRSELLGQQAVT